MKKKVYRTLSLVLAFVLAFGMVSFAADGEANPIATMESKTVELGEEFDLVVTFSNCDEIKTFQLSDFVFGDNLTLVDATPLIEGAAINSWKDGKYIVAFENNAFCNGSALKFTLKVNDNATSSEHDVAFKAIFKRFTEDDDVVIPSEVVAGKIRINGLESPVEDIEDEQANKNEDEIPKDVMTSEKRAEDVICLKIDTSSAYAFGELTSIDDTNDKVVPYIVNDRTLVPLRFVSETLGADVLWEDGWNYCYVNKGDKKIKITFGSADIEVNGEIITYEAPVQVVENRTMVPIRFISEELGYHVHWNQPNQAVVISPADNPWVKDRDAEKSLLTDILVMFLMKGMA